MKPEEIFTVSRVLMGVGNPVAFYPSFAHWLQSVSSGVFLSQFIYWTGKQADKDGWIYKTASEITKETGLTRGEIERSRTKLKSLSILEEQLKGVPAKMWYRIDTDKLDEQFSKWILFHPPGGKIKKNSPPPTPPPGQEEIPPEMWEMKLLFDEYYNQVYSEVGFAWSLAKNGGEHMGSIKEINKKLGQRLLDKKNKGQNFEDDREGRINSWRHILNGIVKMKNDYYRKKAFDPLKINKHLNDIFRDIINETKNSESESTKDGSEYR